MRKPFIFAALAATVMAGGIQNSAQAQVFCEDTGVTIPSGKDCGTTVDLNFGIGEISFNETLDLFAVDVFENEVLYSTLDPLRFNMETGEQLDPFAPEPDADILNLGFIETVLDPTGTVDASFRDFGTPSTLFAVFTFPDFDPTLTGAVDFVGDMAGSLTDGTGVRDGVSISPVGSGVLSYTLVDVNGATVSSLSLGGSQSEPAGPPDSHTYGPFDDAAIANCGAAGCGTVVATILFDGSGFNDRYSMTGRWDVFERNIVDTPESSTSAALLALGFLGLPLLRRKNS